MKVGPIDIDSLRADAAQLWGEAVRLWQSGAIWWFDDNDPNDRKILRQASFEQDRRLGGAVWDEIAADVAEKLVCGELILLDASGAANFRSHFSVQQVKLWVAGSADGAARFDDSMWRQVTEGLKRAGWESRRISGRMRWQLTPEKRDDLMRRFDIVAAPVKHLKRTVRDARALG